MCEWLSCREWSDVRLQCGGRAFAAHRVVLASVSAFLRRILLSCPTEETPTFIVLPDFDLDAMSSVLYYIYNGEVVIQKQKLEMFMEIVNAMQIFVDEKYLPSSCKGDEDVSMCTKFNLRTFEKNEVFCIGEVTDGSYVNFKKEYKSDCSLFSKFQKDSESRDKQIRCADWTKQALGNMESSCGDRQRSFLRDLFMETYPRNGLANGQAGGVRAIQSVQYRGPSQHQTHANSKHLQADDTHEMHSPSDILQTLHNNSTSSHDSHYPSNRLGLISTTELAQMKKLNSAFTYFNPKPVLDVPNSELNNKLLEHFSMQQMQSGIQEMLPRVPTYDIRRIETYAALMNQRSLHTSCLIGGNNFQRKEIDDDHSQINVKKDTKTASSKNVFAMFSKTTVLNEVLDSPWRPRQPTNYKPFRRKVQDTSRTSDNDAKECAINDSNNNIRTSLSPEVTERISTNATTMEPSNNTAALAIGSDFKCTICEQVFITADALAAHSRRHSFPARYSCTECSKSFSQLRNFKYHMSVHRGTREFAATCTVCGKYFNDRGYLSSHMKIHRNRKEYKCPQCPKSFNQRVAYNMHVRIHTGIKPHVCNECGKAFSRKMLLKQHQRTHSGERPYACTHCDKRFADRSNMTLHLRLHTGVKPFSCTLCPKSFTKKHHLKSHLNFHTGAKPYSCPKCNLAFTQSSNMRTHLKKCTAPDPMENANTQSSS